MKKFCCSFCGLPEGDGAFSRYDFNKSKTIISFKKYTLWPSDSADRPMKVPGPYDYVENIKPEWLKEEVKRLFFQPMSTANSPWPNQHSAYNSLGLLSGPAAPGPAMQGAVHYNGARMNTSGECNLVPAMLQPVPVLHNTILTPPTPLPQAWNKVVSEGRGVPVLIDGIKHKKGEEYSSSQESDCDIVVESNLWCTFCHKNGETVAFISSHNLRDPVTKVVMCPILRALRCEYCQATGDFAHTRTHCPLVRNLEGKVCSISSALKSTKRQANGKMRATKPPQTSAISMNKKKKYSSCTINKSFKYLTAH